MNPLRSRIGLAFGFSLLVGAVWADAPPLNSGAAPPSDRTFTYKTVGTLLIKADVHLPAGLGPGPHPVLLWIHGGALMFGGRKGLPRFAPELDASGFVIVSIDYRLAPETRLPDILDDVTDAYRWICETGPGLFGADPRRVAVAGGSAGGYLTLVMGYRGHPRPAALVSFWGYGDIIGPWYSEPSPHPRHNAVKVSREDALKQVAGPPIADQHDRPGNGITYYLYCRQQGLWPRAVTGWDPHREPEKFYPYMPLKNVTPDYPPTLLVHGDQDTDVPYEQSVMMAAELKRNGVGHVFIGVPGAEHGLEHADPETIASIDRRAVAFIREHLKGTTGYPR